MALFDERASNDSLSKGFGVKGRSSSLPTKMKGIFKSFKLISQIFVFREPEMVIGCPTDVKHVAHIGYSSSSNIPSWMAEFNTTDFSSGVPGQSKGFFWGSQEFDQPKEVQGSTGKYPDKSILDAEEVIRKRRKKRKKTKYAPSSSSISSTRSHTSPIELVKPADNVIMA